MEDLFAKCGVHCSHCPSFISNLITLEDRQRCSSGWEKYLGFRLNPEKLIPCEGCQVPDDEKPARYQNCYVRRCAVKTGVKTCAHCSAYPCKDVPSVSLSANAREQIEARHGMPIPEDDYLTFIEPYEGIKHLDSIRISLGSEDIVEKLEVRPVKAPISAFPEDLPFRPDEKQAYKAVHETMASILRAQAKTYARQLFLMKRKRHVLGLLWVLALYGETEGEYADQLVLDGGLFGSRKECGWLVRKRDTSLHVAVEQAMEIMQKHTISFEFAPSQDGWTLKMNFHQEMGGRRTISALKQYVVGLSKLFGEPVYAGSCRFTGEAFARFSKADMSALVSCPDEFKIVY